MRVPGFQLLDMSGPAAVFQTVGKQARTAAGPAYAVHVVSEPPAGFDSRFPSKLGAAPNSAGFDARDTPNM